VRVVILPVSSGARRGRTGFWARRRFDRRKEGSRMEVGLSRAATSTLFPLGQARELTAVGAGPAM
jgi:hypothetical protein